MEDMKLNVTKTKTEKVYKAEGKLKEIFQNRTSVYLGLTKQETLCLFYQIPMSSIIKLKEDKINQLWNGILRRKMLMRKDSNIAIVSTLVPKGTILDDTTGHFGQRVMIASTWVYYNCSDLDSARKVRLRLDSVSQGFQEAGEQIEDMVSPKFIKKGIWGKEK